MSEDPGGTAPPEPGQPDGLDAGARSPNAGLPPPVAQARPPSAGDTWTNEPLDLRGLPQLEDVHFRRIDPRYRTVRLLSVLIRWVVPSVAVWVAIVFADLSGALEVAMVVTVVALVMVSLLATWIEFPYRAWLLRNHDVSYRHGLITRAVTTVPFSRVQHVAVGRNALERAFGLASLEVFTAGSGAADVVIAGLDHVEAERVKQLILQRTQHDG